MLPAGPGSGAVSFDVQSGPGQILDGTNLLVYAGTGTVVVVATKAADADVQPGRGYGTG